MRFADPKIFLEQYSENISKGGMFVRSQKKFELNQEITLIVDMPGVESPLQLRALVVHSSEHGVGLQFTQMDDDTRKAIDKFVDHAVSAEARKASSKAMESGSGDAPKARATASPAETAAGKTGADRRKAARVPARLVVRFSSPKAFLQQYTENISKGGIFIRSDSPLPVGQEVTITLHLPLTQRQIEAAGLVKHNHGGENDSPKGMGIEFTDLTDEDRKLVEAYVHTLLDKKAKGRL